MADTSVATGLTVQQWDDKFFTEYLGQFRFKQMMGTGTSSMIQVKEDLTKKKGDSITFALVNKLSGAGVTGSSDLEGNEESMDSRSFKLSVDKLRNGVRVPEVDEQFSAISLRQAAKDVLKDWIMEKTRDDVITALGSINGTAYASANATARNTWNVDNSDRVLFGATTANYNATHATAVLNVDATNDKLTTAALSLMKRLAKGASPQIRPIRTNTDEEWYVAFVPSLCFRDLREDTAIQAANRDAMARGKDNPLFTGGDLLWDGIIIKEIAEIPVLSGVGNAGADVAQVYLCGAQAIGIGWAKRTKTVTEVFDYGDKHGCACEEIRGIEKLTFGSGSGDTDDLKDHGVVTGFFSAAAD